jgi:hypothetical protein
MQIPIVHTLESLEGEAAIGWLRVRTLTEGTWLVNPELLTMSLQFHRSTSAGRIELHIPDRRGWFAFKWRRPNTVGFDLSNVKAVTVLEWPENSEHRIQVCIDLVNSAGFYIYLNSKGRLMQVDVFLDRPGAIE